MAASRCGCAILRGGEFIGGFAATETVLADDLVKNKTMKCVARNSEGLVEDAEVLTIFCELPF